MRSAVIVSTARTPIGRAYRGAFNDTQAQQLGAHAVRHAVQRAGVDPAEIEDVVMGAALQQGSTGTNVARQIALAADGHLLLIEDHLFGRRRRAGVDLSGPEPTYEPLPHEGRGAAEAGAAHLYVDAGDGRGRRPSL